MARTKSHVVLLILIISAIFVTAQCASTKRDKRSGISDQRLAELETLLALSKMKGKLVTVPVAFGVIDPDKIGKRNHQFEMPALDDDVERNDGVWLREFRQRLDEYKKEVDGGVSSGDVKFDPEGHLQGVKSSIGQQ